MAEQNLGRVSFLMKGTYNAATQYDRLDVVTYNSRPYAAISKPPVGTAPSNTTYWQMLMDEDIQWEDVNGRPDVIDNLTSTSTTDALSANQGKILDEKVASVLFSSTSTGSIGDIINANPQSKIIHIVCNGKTPSDVPTDVYPWCTIEVFINRDYYTGAHIISRTNGMIYVGTLNAVGVWDWHKTVTQKCALSLQEIAASTNLQPYQVTQASALRNAIRNAHIFSFSTGSSTASNLTITDPPEKCAALIFGSRNNDQCAALVTFARDGSWVKVTPIIGTPMSATVSGGLLRLTDLASWSYYTVVSNCVSKGEWMA